MMDGLIRAVMGQGVPIREQEAALKALAFILSQGAPTEGHVALVQEIFARNLIFERKAEGAAAALASTEDLTLRTIAVVTALLAGHVQHGAASTSALSHHPVAAPFAALVLRTLLERVEKEKSIQIKAAALECVAELWTALRVDTVVGFLPGTTAAVCKVLATSYDQKTSFKVVAVALRVLREAVTRACDDDANRAALDAIEEQQARSVGAAGLAQMMAATANDSPPTATGVEDSKDASALLKRIVHSAGGRVKGGTAGAAGDVKPAIKEAEALNMISRDTAWLATVRGKLGALLERTLEDVCARSGKGQVNADAHPHLARFAQFAAEVLAACGRVLKPTVPKLIEVQFLAWEAGGAGRSATTTPATSSADGATEGGGGGGFTIPPTTLCAARAYLDDSSGSVFRGYLESLALEIPAKPHHAIIIAGWITHVLQRDALAELDAVGPDFLTTLLRNLVRVVASVGSSDFKSFSRQHGSVLGAAYVLCGAVARWIPLRTVFDVLLQDLHTFARWRLHHATVWVIKSVVAQSAHNALVRDTAELCSVLSAVVDGFTSTPEQWYFDDVGVGVVAVTHCVVLCRLMLQTFADAAAALFAFRGGEARGLRARDRFLMRVVYPIVEKLSSRHQDLAETAEGVLAVVAQEVYAVEAAADGRPSTTTTTRQSARRVARMVLECFDWIVDAVVARMPFIADYPDTPRALATSLQLLEGLLTEEGADGDLLTLMQHVLHHVTNSLAVIEARARPQQHKESGVLRMIGTTAALLSKSVRLKQAMLWRGDRYSHGAAVTVVTLAAAIAGWHAQAKAGCDFAAQEEKSQEEHPFASHNEVDAWSEERLWCSRERQLAQTVLEKIKHYASAAHVADHLHVCGALRDTVLVFCSYDGVADRLQQGRRHDAPVPLITAGGASASPTASTTMALPMVADLVDAWRHAEVMAALKLPPGASVDDVVPSSVPVFHGGLSSSVLNHLHLIWSPLVARLVPPGFLSIDEVTSRLTKDIFKHHAATGVRVRLKKYALPTVSLDRCVVHVVGVALALLVYVRDFLEDRIRKELWPLLKYHLTLSPHIFYEFAGAKAEYLASTTLFRFQHSCLLLLLLAFPQRLKQKLATAHQDPEGYRFAADRPTVLEPLFKDVIATTERFLDPRQPLVLRAAAARLHAHLREVGGSGSARGPTPAGDTSAVADGTLESSTSTSPVVSRAQETAARDGTTPAPTGPADTGGDAASPRGVLV